MSQQESLIAAINKLQGPIVVFGAGGFIGANLFRTLAKYRTACFAVTHQSSVPYRLKGVETSKVLFADLTNKNSIENIFEKHRFKTIFNLSTYGAFAYQNETEKIFE